MNKLILNFFGEEVTVETPKTLDNLRKEIANQFCFSPSDAAEILVSYYNELKKIFIKTEQDFFDFIKKKIYKVDLDISPDSQLYKKSVLQLEEETENNKKNLDELIKIKVELIAKKKKFVDERIKLIKKMEEKIKELNRKRCKLIREVNKEKDKLSKEINKTNKNIADLQMKLGIQVIELKKPESARPKTKESQKQDKKKTKTIVKKTVKTVKKDVKKKISKKSKEKEEKEPKEEKDMFTKVNETINNMVEKITKVVKDQLKKKTKEVEVEKKKIEDSNIQLKEEEMKGFFDFTSVSQNITEELNKWTKFVAQHTNELTNTLSEKYKNCVDVITSINKKEEEKIKLKAPVVKKHETKIHKGVTCDGCGISPITGNRFKCAICPNFDYCEKCEEKNKESHLHPFIKIYSPEIVPVDIKCEFK